MTDPHLMPGLRKVCNLFPCKFTWRTRMFQIYLLLVWSSPPPPPPLGPLEDLGGHSNGPKGELPLFDYFSNLQFWLRVQFKFNSEHFPVSEWVLISSIVVNFFLFVGWSGKSNRSPLYICRISHLSELVWHIQFDDDDGYMHAFERKAPPACSYRGTRAVSGYAKEQRHYRRYMDMYYTHDCQINNSRHRRNCIHMQIVLHSNFQFSTTIHFHKTPHKRKSALKFRL